eukprot:12382969-Alexandrium_andersonii.AAC.1
MMMLMMMMMIIRESMMSKPAQADRALARARPWQARCASLPGYPIGGHKPNEPRYAVTSNA